MKTYLKALLRRLARTRPIRAVASHLIYPTIVNELRSEIQADVCSPSGVAEAFAWKTHSYIVLAEELRPSGQDCAADGMRHDPETRARIIEVVLERICGLGGDVLEFGVAAGDSLRTFARRCPERRIFGFDSFEGLPEEWWTRPKGAFKSEMPHIDASNVELVKGWFSESIPRFLNGWTGTAAIVHVDCDLYSSTQQCLSLILPHCQPGTVILFDEYYNYRDFAAHEWLAWHELQVKWDLKARCIAYDGRRAAFRLEEFGKPGS
jgi:hypothetical protein